jgi:hypothetical protein
LRKVFLWLAEVQPQQRNTEILSEAQNDGLSAQSELRRSSNDGLLVVLAAVFLAPVIFTGRAGRIVRFGGRFGLKLLCAKLSIYLIINGLMG